MTTSEDFLRSANRQFLYYKTLGEKAIDQLEPEQLFVSLNEDTNSIATIVKHLHGNMLSRWTDFLTTDGEKEWRNRDEEFDISNEQQSIRNEGHTVLEAINRQLAHYPYHIGQMVFYAKILKKSEWTSLSIPKNKSNDYNADKFSKDKSKKHFTDDEFDKLK